MKYLFQNNYLSDIDCEIKGLATIFLSLGTGDATKTDETEKFQTGFDHFQEIMLQFFFQKGLSKGLSLQHKFFD